MEILSVSGSANTPVILQTRYLQSIFSGRGSIKLHNLFDLIKNQTPKYLRLPKVIFNDIDSLMPINKARNLLSYRSKQKGGSMKKTASLFLLIGMLTFIFTSVLSLTSIDLAFAQGDKNFISATHKDGIWILNKSNGKMLYLWFKKPTKTVRPEPTSIPASFDLNKCRIQAFGKHGRSVFLFDLPSGLVTVYQAKGDKPIKGGIILNLARKYDNDIMFSGKNTNFWILDTTTRELIFFHFQSEIEIQESPPVHIPSDLNLENTYMKPVGSYGEGVFLTNPSTGSTTFYRGDSKGKGVAIQEYENVDVASYLTTN